MSPLSVCPGCDVPAAAQCYAPMLAPLLFKGCLLGWSVAWPPGPINAEMLRRGLARGFLPAWVVGLGACSGDFCWALAVALGAGVLVNVPGVRVGLGILSVALLLMLARLLARSAWRAWQAERQRTASAVTAVPANRFDSTRGGYLLGFGMALASPWNIAFWLAVIGSQNSDAAHGLAASLTLAIAVLAGATSWSLFFCTSVSYGARFATPAWQIITPAATAMLMLYFAVHAAIRLVAGV